MTWSADGSGKERPSPGHEGQGTSIMRRMSRVPVYYDEAVLKHDTGPYHPETAGRLSACVEALRLAGAPIDRQSMSPQPATWTRRM